MRRRAVTIVMVLGLVAVSAAAAATPKPDAHDRAVARQLAAKVEELQKLSSASKAADDRITKSLEGCKGLGKTPAESFGVVFAMLPVMLIDMVNELRPLVLDLRATLGAMRPHATLFRRWLDGHRAGIDQILALDNGGKKIDYCAAAKVLLAKNATDAQVEAVLGVRPSVIKAVFTTGLGRSSTVTKLNPRMRAFLIAAGVRRSIAVQLTK